MHDQRYDQIIDREGVLALHRFNRLGVELEPACSGFDNDAQLGDNLRLFGQKASAQVKGVGLSLAKFDFHLGKFGHIVKAKASRPGSDEEQDFRQRELSEITLNWHGFSDFADRIKPIVISKTSIASLSSREEDTTLLQSHLELKGRPLNNRGLLRSLVNKFQGSRRCLDGGPLQENQAPAFFNSDMVKSGLSTSSTLARFAGPPDSRSMTQTTWPSTAPSSRRAFAASRIAPPEVTTSSPIRRLHPRTWPPSAILQVPYSFAFLRTKSTGRPVNCESIVAIGMPPISSPASASIPGGTSGTRASAMSFSSFGSASNRYLSKYSLLFAPERRRNSPVMWAVS